MSQDHVYIPSGPRTKSVGFYTRSNKLVCLVSNHIILQANWEEEWGVERQKE